MNPFSLDTNLIEFTDKKFGSSYFTIRDSVEGIQIFGGIGSGKTSGSGRLLALKYLMNQYGGLVLTAKPDEKKLWQEYCRLTGRENDLIILEPGGPYAFNFLEYESSGVGKDTSMTENIVQVLKTVIRASDEKSSGKSDDPFWETALDLLMFNVIDLCQLAYDKVSVQQMYDIVMTAPKKDHDPSTSPEEENRKPFNRAYAAAQKKIEPQYEAWKLHYTQEQLEKMDGDGIFDQELFNAVPNARVMSFVDQFFADNYRNLSDKTRSIIEFSFSGFLFRLLKDPFYSLFCKKPSNVVPEDCLQGKIILLNLPVKTFHKVGRDSQIMFKYIWQRAMEKRQIEANERPLFLWADEAQNFLHEHDAEYQATARSSRIATVYISQNLPNYHATMGGNKSEARVKSFMGTLGCKIFHANADIETNNYASSLIGEAYVEDISQSTTVAGHFSSGESKSYKLEKMARPEAFVALKTGGPRNNYQTQAYMHRQGNGFSDGMNYKEMKFNQNFMPK